MGIMEDSFLLHLKLKGKIAIENKYDIKDKSDLALVYTPGVASSCLYIKDHPESSYELTGKQNTVAVITDGTAVLGLGDIGPLAAMPVMEGKCAIFKKFAGINAIPIVLNTKDPEEIIKTVAMIAPSFGGINLEDISAPRCFDIERRLSEMLDIPVFHDDQYGTAIVTGAALINALKIVKKEMKDIKVVLNGPGSAGIAITNFFMELGVKDMVLCGKNGIIESEDDRLNDTQKHYAKITNPRKLTGSLKDALKSADVLIGVSVGNVVSKDMVAGMAKDGIIFALANPTPEIAREDALAAGARIYGAGISNTPNQINNALVFPGIFKGALQSRVRDIDMHMKVTACKALASIIPEDELSEDHIIPDVFNEKVAVAISSAIRKDVQSK